MNYLSYLKKIVSKFPDLWHGPGSTMRKFIGFQFILSQLELKELKDQDIFLEAMFYYRKFLFNLLFGHKFALLAFGCTCFNLLSPEFLGKTFMKSYFSLLYPKFEFKK